MLTDGAPRSSMENTHHLLQLLSLTTIFEFDGLSNYIPSLHLSPELRGATNQSADVVATKGCCERQMSLLQDKKAPPILPNNQLLFKGKSNRNGAKL